MCMRVVFHSRAAVLLSAVAAAAAVSLAWIAGDSATAAAPIGESRSVAMGPHAPRGATLELQDARTDLTLRGVDFIDASHGWVVGGEGEHDEKCVMRRTEDGGELWRSLGCPYPLRLEDVSFVDTQTGWAVGVQGMAVRTDDGGLNWTRQDVATTNKLTSVHFIDGRLGWISVAQSPFLLKTEDGGNQWQRVMMKEKEDLSYVWFLDAHHGWAVGGDGVLLATADGGSTWTYLDFGSQRRMYALSFPDPEHGWIAGSEIRATTDGGDTWAVQDPPVGIDPDTARSMVFFDAMRGTAVGDEGMIIHTTDGGATWERLNPELTQGGLLRMTAPNPQWFWAVGVNGTIVRGHDPGAVIVPTGTPGPSATVTPESSPTPRPSPTLTATPEGPWVRVGTDGPFFVPPGADAKITVHWGNMPVTVEIVAEATGPVRFDNGEQQLAWSVSRSSGAGSVPVTVHAEDGATSGTRFSLQITIDGHPSGRPGTIAWQARLPWAGMRAVADGR